MTESRLGACLLAQKKDYVESERLLFSAYRGIKARWKEVQPSTAAIAPWTIEQIKKLYSIWPEQDRPRDWLIRIEDLVFPAKAFAG